MKKLLIFIIFLCINFNAKSQNTIDSISQKIIEIIEKSYMRNKKFFEASGDTLLQKIAIKNAIVDDSVYYIFGVKKIKDNLIFISITEMNRKKSSESYIFQKEKFYFEQKDFEQKDFKVEITLEYFIRELEKFKKYLLIDKAGSK